MSRARSTGLVLLLVTTAIGICDGSVAAQGGPEFVAALSNGRTLTGTLRRKFIKIKTGFGYAVVKIDKLGSITFGTPDLLLTTDHEELRGTVEPKSFRLRQGKDRHTLRRQQLVSIARVVGGGGVFGATGFAGKWSTNIGPMDLQQTGKTVRGSYGYGETAITGKISGSGDSAEAELSYQGGKVRFKLSEDGALMTGTYESDNGRSGFWGGYRIEPLVAVPTPGKITSGQTKSWLNYHLRMPNGFDASDKTRRYPAIAFLHGSNMTSLAYVNTIAIAWPKLAADYILVGFDGENLSPSARPGKPAYNYSYVNFSGHRVGSKGRYRQSPALVAEALDQLKAELPITHWFVGGHSQGGFLTYALAMFYADKVAGVFPMSCNLLVQCEPSFFADKDAAFLARQRAVPIAVIHGENDEVVPFSGGQHGYRSMIDGGFPMVHLFSHKTAAHMFGRLPVERAVRWLEALAADDPSALLSFAERRVAAGSFRDASAALTRIRKLGVPGDLRDKVRGLDDSIEQAARPDAVRLATAIAENRDNGWVDGFLKFRRSFAFTTAARPVMTAYAALRKQQKGPADKVFYAARRIRDEGERNTKYREILDKYYASRWYEMVKGWLDDR